MMISYLSKVVTLLPTDVNFLFDHDDIERFPDGKLCYTVSDPEPTLLEKRKTSKFSAKFEQ